MCCLSVLLEQMGEGFKSKAIYGPVPFHCQVTHAPAEPSEAYQQRYHWGPRSRESLTRGGRAIDLTSRKIYVNVSLWCSMSYLLNGQSKLG